MTEERLKGVLNKHAEWLKTRLSNSVEGVRADLRYADLRYADLQGADLRGADLQGADLQDADLQGADLLGANGSALACPEKGEFIGFKKAKCRDCQVIVELLILADSKRSSASGRKCRCDKAKVLDITSIDGTIRYTSALSIHDSNFIYNVDETVTVDDFDDNRWNECAPGIHFFITRKEAVDY